MPNYDKVKQIFSKTLTFCTVNCRRQRTAEEATKLAQVQTELQKIDLLVAQDVKILRQTIEVASVEYMQAK